MMKIAVVLPVAVLSITAVVLSYPSGAAPGTSGSRGVVQASVARQLPSCGACHRLRGSRPTVHVDLPKYTLDLGETIAVTTRSTGGRPGRAGGFVNDVTAGSFTAGAGSRTQSGGRYITHANPISAGRNWSYSYTAPQTPGLVELYAVVNTVDGSGGEDNDAWGFHGADPGAMRNTPVRLYAQAPGVVEWGAGCDGAFGNRPVLGAPESPRVGNASFSLEIHGAPPSVPFTILFGAPLAAPIDLSAIGINGCSLHVQAVASVPGATGGGNAQRGEGSGSIPLPIPPTPGLAGAGFAAQGVLVDFNSGRSIALTLTNGVVVTIQP